MNLIIAVHIIAINLIIADFPMSMNLIKAAHRI
jgi:hypothetical protein